MIDSFRYLSLASIAVVKMLIARASKDAIPWTPVSRPLAESTVALISTAALSLNCDAVFDTQGERANPWWGDPSYRVIPRTATEADITASHLHIETAYLLQDIDVALPLRRLEELHAGRRRGMRRALALLIRGLSTRPHGVPCDERSRDGRPNEGRVGGCRSLRACLTDLLPVRRTGPTRSGVRGHQYDRAVDDSRLNGRSWCSSGRRDRVPLRPTIRAARGCRHAARCSAGDP